MAEEFEKPQYSEQEQIRRAKLAKYCEEGRDPYTITRFDRTHTSAEVLSNFDALEGKTVRIAGRMMSRRIMGKASFVHMMDGEGQIQAYVRREDVGEDVYADANSRRHRLIEHVDVTTASVLARVLDGAYLHLRTARRYADHHT